MSVAIRLDEEQTGTTALVTVEDAPEQAAALVPEVGKVVERARALEVIDEQSNLMALELVKKCKQGQARVEKLFGDARQKSHSAWKSITAAIARLVDPLKEAERICGQKSYEWSAEERRKREAEELARQKAETAKQEEARLDVADFLQQAGAEEEAERVLDEPIIVVPHKVEAPVRPEGVVARQNWQFSVIDAAAIPREYTMPDLVKLGKVVKALKSETRIPGIRVFDVGSIAVRR
jgi:hypothetical protein